jgi:RNA polymerase sigma factor for flagellar operon FliA
MNKRPPDAARDSAAILERFHSHLAFVDSRAATLFRSVGHFGVVTFDDLRGFGLEGLLNASRSYDASSGVPFGAWAQLHVRRAMFEGLRQWGYTRGELRRLRLERAAVCLRGSGPVAAMGMEEACADDPANSPEQLLARAQEKALVRAAIAQLPPMEREVVQRFDLEGRTLGEAAAAAGVSKPWASQLRARALGRLSGAVQAAA